MERRPKMMDYLEDLKVAYFIPRKKYWILGSIVALILVVTGAVVPITIITLNHSESSESSTPLPTTTGITTMSETTMTTTVFTTYANPTTPVTPSPPTTNRCNYSDSVGFIF